MSSADCILRMQPLPRRHTEVLLPIVGEYAANVTKNASLHARQRQPRPVLPRRCSTPLAMVPATMTPINARANLSHARPCCRDCRRRTGRPACSRCAASPRLRKDTHRFPRYAAPDRSKRNSIAASAVMNDVKAQDSVEVGCALRKRTLRDFIMMDAS